MDRVLPGQAVVGIVHLDIVHAPVDLPVLIVIGDRQPVPGIACHIEHIAAAAIGPLDRRVHLNGIIRHKLFCRVAESGRSLDTEIQRLRPIVGVTAIRFATIDADLDQRARRIVRGQVELAVKPPLDTALVVPARKCTSPSGYSAADTAMAVGVPS